MINPWLQVATVLLRSAYTLIRREVYLGGGKRHQALHVRAWFGTRFVVPSPQQFHGMAFASKKLLVLALVLGTITSLALPLPWPADLAQLSKQPHNDRGDFRRVLLPRFSPGLLPDTPANNAKECLVCLARGAERHRLFLRSPNSLAWLDDAG